MRHGVKKAKLQRTASHRKALLANQACSLITHGRITTTLAKAKALRPYVEKLITLAKNGSLHARRQALATLPQPAVVTKLFGVVADACKDRQGGYCRIVKLGQRMTDSAPMALIEIIDLPQLTAPVAPSVTTGTASSPEVAAPAAEEVAETPAEVEETPAAAEETPAEEQK
ncbi:MAG: 50S ribosomal protein L17 [Akkermansiaceae bacterium]|nr:50S ribosomal protein L17 [Akkermansiaceae bacterium]